MRKYILFLLIASVALFSEQWSAEEILNKMEEVTRGSVEELNNVQKKGLIEMKAMGLKGTFSEYVAQPNNYLAEMYFEGIGDFTQGCNGEIVWQNNLITGPRILEGFEKDVMMNSAKFNAMFDCSDFYKNAEYYGMEPVCDENCYVINVLMLDYPATLYIAEDSFLLFKMVMSIESELGKMESICHFSDYRAVDGMQMPFKMICETSGIEMVITYSEVLFNTDLSEDIFALPEEVEELL